MTTKSGTNRSGFVREKRSGHTTKQTRPAKQSSTTTARRSYRPETKYLPIEPRTRREPGDRAQTRNRRASNRTQGYDIAFNFGGANVRAPSISLPQVDFSNPRWISGIMTIVLGVLLLMMWNSSTFAISTAEVSGNVRIGASEVSAMLGVAGQPIFKVVPGQIEENLRTAYHDLEEVNVRIGLPNRVRVEVVERTPVLAWFQDGAMTWIDANGIAFTPRGEVPGLVQVAANGEPLDVVNEEGGKSYEARFINPGMVQVIVSLAPFVPAGVPMVYDPQYGIGWQDPGGWAVYFGQNTQEIGQKLSVYQALVERLINQGIQPTLISMEYLDAPLYK